MARIRSTGTKPEETLALLLAGWLPGEAILRNPREVFGTPDFYLPRLRIAVFLDGCFFHGCPRHYRPPADHADYWQAKHKRNRKRDQLVNRTLRSEGARVLRIWEHEMKGKKPVGRERVRRRIRYACEMQERLAVPTSLAMVAEKIAPYSTE